MKIDAHQHFWKYSKTGYGWIDEKMQILKKDHLPDDLQPILKKNGLDGTIAVQARQNLDETRWLLGLADNYDFIKGVVGWVDLQSEQVEAQLELFATHPKLVGIRHVVQDEPDERFLLRKTFLRGIEKLQKYDLAYDILIFPKHLPMAIEFATLFPEQHFVLDHIAKPFIKRGTIHPWDEYIRQLAALPNVCCKVSGLVTEADWQRWTFAHFIPYLKTIFEAFGVDRIMFGSDWPVCTVATSYQQVCEIFSKYIQVAGLANHVDALWGGNAQSFYQIPR